MDGMSTSKPNRIDEVSESYKDDEQFKKIVTKKLINMKN
jgi:hypothetical protein